MASSQTVSLKEYRKVAQRSADRRHDLLVCRGALLAVLVACESDDMAAHNVEGGVYNVRLPDEVVEGVRSALAQTVSP